MSVLNKVNVISSVGYDCKICQKLSYERQESIAGVFSTYAHSWLTCGPELFVVNNSDGVLQSYWTFGENPQDDLEITCAVELPLEGCAIPLLILGISSENVNLICFFNPNTRKILRTIDIIYPVRTICVIEDGTNEVYPLNDALTPTEGLIAVGCAEGTILLIDLCRSILCKAVNGDFQFYSTEENPSEVVYVGVNSVTSEGFSQKILESRKKKNCVSVILTDPSDEGITALLYSIESAVLFVGTSSGSFHLWNMSSLSCLFKSPATNRAIISLSLLEPCDDPRHSLYLWICFEQYAQVAMYCISFSSKFFVHGYGVYYQNFESAGLVYRFTLGMEVDVIAKRPICSQAIAKLVPKNLVRCISLPEAEGTHLRLFITAYEIIDKGQVSIKAVIFDLNQWYRDQMPEEGISACLDSIDLDSKSLWHLQLDPSSLTLYQCVRPQEQHFYPTAYDFQVWCIEEEGVRCLEKLGLQTQWLRNMSRMGSKALIEPTQIFLGALAAGLLPSFVDPPDPEANNEIEERSYVLTICLENRIIMVIEDCVKDWNSGGYTVRGCTIQFLLDWLWSLHRTYKTNGNKICIPLFDQSGMKFDVSEKRSLQHCKSLLNTVQSVYTNIVNRFKNTIIISGVEEKLTAMSLVRLYFDCCLKLVSVNLLPEPNDLGRPSGSVLYHFDNINTYASNRRKAGPFLGDSLLGRTEAEKQWLEEGGTGLYPPPSIQSVLRFCLHPSPSIANKMSLLLYLFMDIINSYTPIRSQPVIDRIKNFQHLMRIPEVQYKIVAGCWYFDHSFFDEGVDLLFDPRVLCVDLNEHQHRGILHLLASEGQEKLALQYLRLKSPTLNLADDLRMELSLLLSNGLVNEAFLFQRKHPEMRETLLIEFFEGCIERKQLGQVFGLNLDFKEEATLMKYLRSSSLKEKGDLQVLLLLSKAKYTEAMFLNDKLNSSINGPKSKIETDTRDMIVKGITGSLNTISRHMANEMKTYRPPPAGSHPRPLSSLIKVRNGPDGPICQTDSKVLLSAFAKSTRHLSDFVNSFESGLRRKREDKDTDFEFDHEPSRKRLKFWDNSSDINKVPSFKKGKWLTSSCEPSASQERDVMELVGTPLVKKHGKRFSPQSKPSSILKGKTPEKSIIPEDFGETPKKSIRFTLPGNEVQITGRKPLRENETSVSDKYSKIAVDIKNKSATSVTEEFSKPRGLGKPSARKPLHGTDSLNNSVTGHDSSSVIDTIKDRLRSSAKKKVLEDGVNWHEVAEASKPRVLFTQGVSKITSVIKSDITSSTPMSQVLLDITVTSCEKKYLDSPSRGKETSPITETLFNTTLLPKVLFSSDNNEKEIKKKSPEVASVPVHAAFLEKYKQLRNKNVRSNNGIVTPEKEKKRCATFEEEQSLDDVCTTKTVELFKSSNATSSVKIVIDEDTSKKESAFNENILKESDELDKELVQDKNKLELAKNEDEPNNESLPEEPKMLEIRKQSLSAESGHISINDESYQDIENCLNENNQLLKDGVSSYKDEDDVPGNQVKVTEWCGLKLTEIERNCSYEVHIDNYNDACKFQNIKETQIFHDVCNNDQSCFNKSKSIEPLPSKKSNSQNKKDENVTLNEKEKTIKQEVPGSAQCNVTKPLVKDHSKEVNSNSKKDCEEIIDIASDDEDKQSYDETLSDEESEVLSGETSEEIEEEMSEKEENGSENEGSLPDVSSISSDGDHVENSDESVSIDSRPTKSAKKKIEKNENVEREKGQTGKTPIFVLSDDSGDETSKNKKKGSSKKVSNVKTGDSKTKHSPEHEQHYEEDVSDSEVFGLKNVKIDNKGEDNSDDNDMWIGLDDMESSVSKKLKESKTDNNSKDYDLQKSENFHKSLLQPNLDSHKKELGDCEKGNLKPFHSTNHSRKESFSGFNQPNIIKDDVEHDPLNNTNIDIAEKKSVSGLIETSVLYESIDCDILPMVSNPVSDVLSDQELIENSFASGEPELIKDTTSVKLREEKVVAENQQEADNFFVVGTVIKSVSSFSVEDPVIEAVSSFTAERPTTETVSEEEMLAEESESIPLTFISGVSSLNNEDEKYLGNAEEDMDLKEDYQSIERNWTQQIEEEMEQDNVILKIDSGNNESINICNQELLSVDGSKTISKELTDSKSINESECQGFKNSTIVASLQTLEVEHSQKNILISDELKNLSRSSEIDAQDFSIRSTTKVSLGDDALIKDINNLYKSECILPQSDNKYKGDDLVIPAGTHKETVKENIISYSKDLESPLDKTTEASSTGFEVSAKGHEEQTVIILEENDRDEQNTIKASLYDPKEPNDHHNSKVSHLNPEVGNDQTTEEGYHVDSYKYNNDTEIPATLLPLQESLTKHSDESDKTDQKNNFSLETSSTKIPCENTIIDMSSDVHQSVLCKVKENIISNNNENVLTEKNASSFVIEKCRLPGGDLSHVNLISVEEANKLCKNIGKCSDESVSSGKFDSVESIKDQSCINLKMNTNDCVSMIPTSKSILLPETKLTEHDEAQHNCDNAEIMKNESELEHGDESTKAKTSDRISSQVAEKGSGNCRVAGEIEVMYNIKEISDEVESKNFGTNSEIICKNRNDMVPSSSEVKIESREMKGIKPFKQEDNVRDETDKVMADSKLAEDNNPVTNKLSNSLSNFSDHSYQLTISNEKNFEHPVEVFNSDNIVPGFEGISDNILNEHYNIEGENVSKIHDIVCETKAHENEKVIKENISLSGATDDNSNKEPIDCQLNNAKLDVCNDSSTSDTLNSLKKEINYDVEHIVSSAENDSKISSENNSVKKSFFFGKEDIETYIRSAKATFQIGSRLSLPEEDEPIDPMEVAMIEDDEKMFTEPSSTEPDIELSLHLSPERLRKPKKVDQGIVTENSYLQRRARKLRKSVKKLETDESCNKKLENKIVNPEDHISSMPSVDKELKCISTQTSDGVLDEIGSSESEEEAIDYTKIPGPSQKSVEHEKKIIRKMRQSSEPPLTQKEEFKRRSSVCPEKYYIKEEHYRGKRHSQRLLQDRDVKGILKNKDSIEDFDEELKTQSKADHLPVRRSRRLSECGAETSELLRNLCEKDQRIKSQRRCRGYSEEPDIYSMSSREPEIRASLNKKLEKRKVQSASTNLEDEYTLRRHSRRISEETDIANKYSDKRRNSKNPDDFSCDFTNLKQSEEPEIRSILKKSSKGSRKTSLSCEMINELNHCEDSDLCRVSRKLRSQSEEPEPQGIPKKRYRQSSSYTHETAADLHSQVEKIPMGIKKIHRQSEGPEIQGILKKRNNNKSRSSLLPDVNSEIKIYHTVDQPEENREFRKHTEVEIQGILKKNRKQCRSSDNETVKSKHFTDVLPERNRRARRHSEEPEMLKTLKRRERRGSQSSDIDNEINLLDGRWEGVQQMRRHSEEPEVRGISQKRSIISRKSLYTTETASDSKFQFEDDIPYESRKSKEKSDKFNVKGILKKSKRRNSNTGEAEKGLIHLESDSPEHKKSHFLIYKSGEKISNISEKTDSINCAKTQEDFKSDEECLSTNKNTLKNQTCSYVSGTNDKNNKKSYSDGMVKMATDADIEPKETSLHSSHSILETEKIDADNSEDIPKLRDNDNKVSDFSSSTELFSENKRARRFNLMSAEAERQSVKESPAKVRRRSSSSTMAKEPVDIISLPEEGIRNTRKSLRKTPDKKEDNTKVVEDRKRKVEPENLKFVPKRLDYSDDDESPKQKKSRSLIDFPIKRNSRLPRPALDDIREEDEDLIKKKSLDDFHIEEMKKKASKKQSISNLVIADSDADSDVSTPELWKKDFSKEKRLTRTQQKLFLMNQQLTSITEVESPTSSPRRSIRKKADTSDSPLKTPTRSSLRLQKKPPSETD